MNKGILFALVLGMSVATPVWAQDTGMGDGRSGMSLQDALEAGKKTGKDSVPDYNKVFNKDNAQGAVPHKETDEKTSFWQDASNTVMEILQAGSELLLTCMGGQEGADDQLRCEAVRMLMNSKEKKAAKQELVKPDDPLVQMRDLIMKDPAAITGSDWLGEYTDCKETVVDIGGDFEYRVCSDVLPVDGTDEEVCALGENVILDPNTLYQCNRTIAQLGAGQCSVGNTMNMDTAQIYQCGVKPKNRETVPCETTRKVALGDWCLDETITGVQGDMEHSITSKGGGEYQLTFGKKGRRYWSGNPYQIYERTFNLTINNVGAIAAFSAIKVEYEDWLQIRVNGTLVYNGPKGGDKEDITGKCAWKTWLKHSTQMLTPGSSSSTTVQTAELIKFTPGQAQPNNTTLASYYGSCSESICAFDVLCQPKNPYISLALLSQYDWLYLASCSTVNYKCPSDRNFVGMKRNPNQGNVTKIEQVQYNSSNSGDIDQGVQYIGTVNVNLVPYLKEGENTITTRTVVGGTGDTYIEFLLRTMCDEWDDGCSSLGMFVETTTP